MSDFYRHICKKCGFKSEDPHFLKVCPDCSEPGVTNDIPIGDFSDEFIDEDIVEDSQKIGSKMNDEEIQQYIENVGDNGGSWLFSEDDEKVKEAYYLSHSLMPELDMDKDWAEFLNRKCAVCGVENPNKIHLFSPSKEFAQKYLFIQSDDLHKIVFTRICTICSKHPGFIDALKRQLIKIYSGTN